MVRFRTPAALVLTLALAAAPAVRADVRPNSLFSDNAVLQQGISVPVWGTANDDEKVTVTFGGQKVSTVARDGKWMVRLRPMKAGGPFTMTIAGDNVIKLRNILVGEVWVCSGQSNMQWPVKQSANSDETIASCKDPMLRLFTVGRAGSTSPVTDVNSSWKECAPDVVPDFTAVGYFFGRDLRRALNVPVGLINTSYGGTRVQAWTSARYVLNTSQLRREARKMPDWAKNPNRPSVLYNAMIAPLIPYAIRGAIWYQGESNAGEAYAYRTLFPTMITNWREDWGQGDFPFLFVQLAPYRDPAPEPGDSTWAELREAQLLTTRTCPNTAMAVITDYGDPKDIHPKQKEPVGARLALAARALAYGQKVVYSGPVYKSRKIKGDSIVVYFDHVGSGLMTKGDKLTGFAIAGGDRKFVSADAEIVGDKVVVRSAQVPRPVAVRYGWADCPIVNLFNKEGLPATPFRTDDFPLVTGPK